MAFRGPFNIVTLRLQSVQPVNQDTKRFRFALPDPNAYPGLTLTCMGLFLSFRPHPLTASPASLLTVHRPAWSLFPVFRPYTPVNSFGKTGEGGGG